MKIKIQTTEIVKKEEVIEIQCNNCGKSEKGDNISYESTIETWSHSFGYGSKFDGDCIEFELCDKCYKKIIDNFKIKPKIVNSF